MALHTRGRILRVDLTEESVESVAVPEAWLHRYVGGKGLGARYLYEELDAGTDPLGPDNVLMFLLGPVSGLLPGESRYAAVTKSPLTGGFLDSYAGGRFPETLAGALSDHVGVLVTGAASSPVRLVVADDDATLEPATTWGEDAAATAEAFPDAATACIGPAGEHRVAYATIASDGGEHHAGRGGAGAVMGAKRLKAVVARGDPPTGLDELREEYADRYRDGDTGQWLRSSGTVETVDFADAVGALSTRGWQETTFEGAGDVGIDAVRSSSLERDYEGDDERGFRVETDAGETIPRGATAMSLGAGLGIDEFDAVAAIGETCNRLGLDLISAGNAVAWAIRANEEGLIDRAFDFGDPAGARELLTEIARRETDLGDALADGVDAVGQRYDGDDLVPTVKAMELPAYDPRGAQSMALAYATSDRGACHRRARTVEREVFDGGWTPRRAARAVADEQDQRSVLWCLVVDDFVGDVFEDLGAAWLDAVGLETAGDLETVGERIWTLTRLFNVREGVSRADDELPPALAEAPDGPGSGIDPDRFDAMLDAYYAERGWGPDGRPLRETVERLGLDEAVDDETRLATTQP
ncbi:aldehyde ferredoxin oxidoreductase family protein [Halorussus salilacus]|uniref:aldehyde ferredoxin oxidoreductase family protein n=1 Tax=Halorussus salilacus TaxID=2953750 RepID=UPI0034A46F01